MNRKIWLVSLVPLSVLFVWLIFLITQLENRVTTQENTAVETIVSKENETNTINTSTTINVKDEVGEVEVKTEESTTTTVKNTDTLAVNPSRCRGCGKCVMIDSEHFEMSGRTAVVVSQENLDSSKLKQAISICPDEAISLK